MKYKVLKGCVAGRGIVLAPGEEVELAPELAKTLLVMGRLEEVEAPAPEPETPTAEAEPEAAEEAKPNPGRKKRSTATVKPEETAVETK